MQRCCWWCVVVCLGGSAGGCSSESKEAKPATDPRVELVRPIVLHDDARIPQNDPAFAGVEIRADRLIFSYTRPIPESPLQAGQVVVGNTGDGYLRRIVSIADLGGGRFEALTKPAQITELIKDGAFKIRIKPQPANWVAGGGKIGGRSYALENSLSVFGPTSFSGVACGVASSSSYEFQPILDLNFDIEFDLDISLGLFESQINSARMVVSGGYEVGYVYKTLADVSMNCTVDLIQIMRRQAGNPDLYKKQLTPFRFFVGPIPLSISHSVDPIAAFTSTTRVNAGGFETRYVTAFSVTAGAEHVDGGWRKVWNPRRSGSVVATLPEEVFDVDLQLQLSGGMQYSMFVWDTAGPKLGLQASLTGKHTTDREACAWKASLDAGLDLVGGVTLQIPVIEATLAEWSATANLAKVEIASTSGSLASGVCRDAGTDGGKDGGVDGGRDGAADAVADLTRDLAADTIRDLLPSDTFSGDVTWPIAPTITSIAPTAGSNAGGEMVTITGTQLRNATVVTIDGTACKNVTCVQGSAGYCTQISCTTSARWMAGKKDVVVDNQGLKATLAKGFEYQVPTSAVLLVKHGSGSAFTGALRLRDATSVSPSGLTAAENPTITSVSNCINRIVYADGYSLEPNHCTDQTLVKSPSGTTVTLWGDATHAAIDPSRKYVALSSWCGDIHIHRANANGYLNGLFSLYKIPGGSCTTTATARTLRFAAP